MKLEKYLNETISSRMRDLKSINPKAAKRAQNVVDKVNDFLGKSLAKEFKEANSGDVDPILQSRFKESLQNVVVDWVAGNVLDNVDYE